MRRHSRNGRLRRGVVKKSTLGAILIVVLGLAFIGIYKLVAPMLFERGRRAASDVKTSLTLRIGGDNYLGYFFLTSPQMRHEAARRGIAIDFQDDGAAYGKRLEKFAKGELD